MPIEHWLMLAGFVIIVLALVILPNWPRDES